MKTLILLLLCVCSFYSFGQDERFYRSMFNGVLSKKNEFTPYKVKVFSPKYMIDLNRDGIKESFQTVKKDGIDFIRLNNSFGELIFEASLFTKGSNSSIYKANFFNVKENVDVLVLHFYEGENSSATFEASGRLYFITILNQDMRTASLTRGPYFWHERERAAGKYWNRKYTVNFVDYNNDGTREISVSFNDISRIYYYTKNGVWKTI